MRNKHDEVKLVVYGDRGNTGFYDASITYKCWVEWVREGLNYVGLPEDLRELLEDSESLLPLTENIPGDQLIELQISIRSLEAPNRGGAVEEPPDEQHIKDGKQGT